MNRCPSATRSARHALSGRFGRSALFLALALLVAAAGAPRAAQAQVEPLGESRNEAASGGRNFPVGTLRGKLVVVEAPEIRLDGQPDRFSPGVRIRGADNMLTVPGALIGQRLLVNYTRDAAGLVREVWVLTPVEAKVERASAERPFLNFWPFVASTGPRDDGKTPFDQLPKFGE
ncbi:MAG: hypothetical protein EOO24_07685 [Comamonadaceae bacterium]|nr:MAG: hypothetical protein EOO24_07685 [Comamonadaceae bacterium]